MRVSDQGDAVRQPPAPPRCVLLPMLRPSRGVSAAAFVASVSSRPAFTSCSVARVLGLLARDWIEDGAMSWTDDKIELLKKLHAEGLSCSRIAARVGGVSRNAVIGKIHRLGLHLTPNDTVRAQRARLNSAHGTKMRNQKKRPQKPWDRTSRAPQAGNSAAAIAADVSRLREEVITVPPDKRRGLVDLEPNQCRWPIGDPQSADFHFCNRSKVDGKAYCLHHVAVAYEPPKVRERVSKAASRNELAAASIGRNRRALEEV